MLTDFTDYTDKNREVNFRIIIMTWNYVYSINNPKELIS